MKSPNVHLPTEELRKAIFVRLDGKVFRLDGTTPLPIHDEIPEDFRDFDFLEIDSLDGEPMEETHPSLYGCVITINIYSTYAGYKEVSREMDQVSAFLGSELRTMNGFTDVSQGGVLIKFGEVKVSSDEGTIVRHGMFQKRWMIADNKL